MLPFWGRTTLWFSLGVDYSPWKHEENKSGEILNIFTLKLGMSDCYPLPPLLYCNRSPETSCSAHASSNFFLLPTTQLWSTPSSFSITSGLHVSMAATPPKKSESPFPFSGFFKVSMHLGPVVKNQPASAGDSSSISGPGWHGATKPVHNCWAHVSQLLKRMHPRAYALQQEKPLPRDAHTPQLESEPPLSATRESLHAATKTQPSQK